MARSPARQGIRSLSAVIFCSPPKEMRQTEVMLPVSSPRRWADALRRRSGKDESLWKFFLLPDKNGPRSALAGRVSGELVGAAVVVEVRR